MSGDAENENDVDIPDDFCYLFARMIDQIETNNNKIKYVLSIKKSLQEDIETTNLVLKKERENYNQLNKNLKNIEISYYSLVETNKNNINDIDNIHENLYDMDCRIIQNNQYSRREN